MNFFLGLAQPLTKLFPFLKLNLLHARIKKDSREYIAKCLETTSIFFIFILVIFVVLIFIGIKQYILFLIILVSVSFLFFLSKIFTPSLISLKRIRDIERNLSLALQNLFVEISSGVPLFEILTNISKAGYGEVSKEFAKVVGKINAGKSQTEALEEMIVENPSVLFRRSMWQIVNGMKSGSDLSSTIEQTITLLSEEKLIQIQNYGSRLNPLAMFYMLLGIIFPALSIIFLIIFVSVSNLESNVAKTVFYVFYVFILLFQIFFLGLINMRRPSLL